MSELPAIHQLVTLRDDLGQEFASRVEDADDGALTVARPLDLPVEHRLQVGAEVFTTWLLPTGIEVRPGRLTGVRKEGLVSLWDIELTEPGWREQRRSFVRAAVPGKVTLQWKSDEDVQRVARGLLLDLSEAGLRCTTSSEELGDEGRPRLPLRLTVETSEQKFELDGEILRVGPAREAGLWQVVALFTEPGKAADDLRRIVFAQQLRDRRR